MLLLLMGTFFTSSFGKVAYTDTKSGKPVIIFLHGLPTSKELWNSVLVHINSDIRVITFDLNGYGQSEMINFQMSHHERAQVLDELRAHIGLSHFILVAHDLGSSVAIDYMKNYSKYVSKLVIMSPPVYPDFKEPFDVIMVRKPVLGPFLIRILRNFLFKRSIRHGLVNKTNLTPNLLQAFAGPFSTKDGRKVLYHLLRWGHPKTVFKNYPKVIKSITVPTLILQGRNDPYIPYSQVERLNDDIENSKLIIIEDARHFLPIDVPEELAHDINAFVSED